MSQYVPPHLRNRSSSVPSAPSVTGPSLPPRGSSTMASLTVRNRSSTSSGSSGSSGQSAPPAGSDFPSLAPPKSVHSSPWSNGTKSFADLARSWAVEQKEQEEKDKIQAKERMTQAQREKEKEEKERAFYRVDVVDSTRLIYGISQNGKDSQKKNRYDETDEDLDSTGEDDLTAYDDDDNQEAREADADWNYRRNRNDLY